VAVPESVLAALSATPQRATLAGGATIAWDGSGQGDLAVLLIHGYPLDRGMWREQLGGIARHRLIAPDLRGFGDSSDAAPAATIAAHADDMVELLDTLELDRAVVVGLSMGGYIALDMAARHRNRLAGLVLMDTRADADDEQGRAGRDSAIAAIRDGRAGEVLSGLAAKLFAADTAAGIRDGLQRRMGRVPAATLVASLEAMRDRHDRRPLLGELAGLATLIVVGSEDRITPPAMARAMASAIPAAELVEVEGAGHLTPVERPATVNEALQAFLDRISGQV
jgi:pimeloyl-ACP methyl ester carboxylesterase